jgi:transposase
MIQQLLHLLKNKQGKTAFPWISFCSSCSISELEAFALSLQKEWPAFQVACSLPYNNRMAEGFVNKLKHIKSPTRMTDPSAS